jgi:DNA-binding NtrC family response regulator
MRTFAQKYRKEGMLLQEAAARQLMAYPWPGNIRELRNIMERLVIRCRDGLITREAVVEAGIHGQPMVGPVVVPVTETIRKAAPPEVSQPSVLQDSRDDDDSFGTGTNDDRDESAPVASASTIQLPAGGVNLEQVERDLVIQALERADWNQKEAAALLGISVDRMNSRVKKFGLRHSKWRVNK